MVHESGTLPYRIVIRDLGDQHVVHTQVLEPGREPWYHQGDYFAKLGDAPGVILQSQSAADATAAAATAGPGLDDAARGDAQRGLVDNTSPNDGGVAADRAVGKRRRKSGYSDWKKYYYVDGHPNPAGARKIAEAIFDESIAARLARR